MPGLAGNEVYARVRAAGITAPVLFISGHGAYELADQIDEQVDVDILTKPFRLDTLRQHCAALLAGATAPA